MMEHVAHRRAFQDEPVMALGRSRVQMMLPRLALTLGCWLLVAGGVEAQTRSAEVARRQAEKAAQLGAETPNALEQSVFWIETGGLIERVREGLGGIYPRFGGLSPAGGLGLGAGYRYHFRSGGRFETGYVGSFRGYHLASVELGLPPAAGDRLQVVGAVRYRQATQERYFGVGIASDRDDRTHFGLEDTLATLNLRVVPRDAITIGVEAGWLAVGIGPGRGDFPSIEARFTSSDTPGLDEQPDFWFTRVSVEVDSRDVPTNPRAGGRHWVEWSWYRDRDLGRYDFRRMEVELEQFVPFFHKRRVLALRARAVIADAGDDRHVPFYLMPVLGGPESLRGFREHRFRDENLLLFTAEYRWEAFAALDMALFADAGRAATRRQGLTLSEFETSYGVGFRFSTRQKLVARLDIARGAEGTRVYLRFRPVF